MFYEDEELEEWEIEEWKTECHLWHNDLTKDITSWEYSGDLYFGSFNGLIALYVTEPV